MLIIDLTGPPQTRIVNVYRPFNPKQISEMSFFCNQVTKLDEIVLPNTIILGDFNLDINKKHLETYPRKNYFVLMQNILGHHGLDQLVNEDTWSRVVNGIVQSSRIDHVYTTVRNRITNLKLVNNAFSDHEMVEFELTNTISKY